MDQGLVMRAMAGEHDAFSELVRGELPQLFTLARLILRDTELAEDAVQEALIAAWRDLSGLRDPARFQAWIRSLLVRACYREGRRHRRRQIIDSLARPETGVDADPAVTVAQHDQIETAFLNLAPQQRALLVLHFYLGLPLSATAEALGLPVGTVKTRLYRTTQQMRASMDADARLPLLGRQAT